MCGGQTDRVWTWLLRSSCLSALFIASFESEGPENHMEKDGWKTLRPGELQEQSRDPTAKPPMPSLSGGKA